MGCRSGRMHINYLHYTYVVLGTLRWVPQARLTAGRRGLVLLHTPVWASCLQSEHSGFWPLMAKPPPPPRSGTSLRYKSQPENPTPLELQENTNRTMERCWRGDPSAHGAAGPGPASARTPCSQEGRGAPGSCRHPPAVYPLCTLLLFQSIHKLLYNLQSVWGSPLGVPVKPPWAAISHPLPGNFRKATM